MTVIRIGMAQLVPNPGLNRVKQQLNQEIEMAMPMPCQCHANVNMSTCQRQHVNVNTSILNVIWILLEPLDGWVLLPYYSSRIMNYNIVFSLNTHLTQLLKA